jgi:hypothetical protein
MLYLTLVPLTYCILYLTLVLLNWPVPERSPVQPLAPAVLPSLVLDMVALVLYWCTYIAGLMSALISS